MKKLKLILTLILSVAILSSCSNAVENSADELTLNSWRAKLDNGTVMSLDFEGDRATLIVKREDTETVEISGLCEVSDSAFVIHDELTQTIYAFEYDVNFDRINVVYDTNTVPFDKK